MSTSLVTNEANIVDNSKIHRVLAFQGGGALGAYEAGVYKALCKKLREDTLNDNKPLFDVVAGTSAGAINTTLILNNVLQNKDDDP